MSLRTRVAAVVATVPLALAGCSAAGQGQDTAPAPAATTGAAGDASPTPGQEVDTAAFFDRTEKAMTDARTYTTSMTMTKGAETLTVSGKGDIGNPQRPLADLTMTSPTGEGRMHLVVDGRTAYLKAPGAAGDRYVEMPVTTLGQASGQDLSTLVDPAANLRAVRGATAKVVHQGIEDKDGEKLTHYVLTLNPRKVQRGFASGEPRPLPSAVPETLPSDVWLDDAHRVRVMTMRVDGVDMTMTTTGYGRPVTITPPPKASVTQLPGLSGPASSAPSTPSPAPATTTRR